MRFPLGYPSTRSSRFAADVYSAILNTATGDIQLLRSSVIGEETDTGHRSVAVALHEAPTAMAPKAVQPVSCAGAAY